MFKYLCNDMMSVNLCYIVYWASYWADIKYMDKKTPHTVPMLMQPLWVIYTWPSIWSSFILEIRTKIKDEPYINLKLKPPPTKDLTNKSLSKIKPNDIHLINNSSIVFFSITFKNRSKKKFRRIMDSLRINEHIKPS